MPLKTATAVSATTAEKPKKRYPGEAKGFVEEMRFVAMKLHTREQAKEGEKEVKEKEEEAVRKWEPSVDGYLKFLVDSKLVYDTLEGIVEKAVFPFYAEFRNTGLERSEKLANDLEWFKEQGYTIPEPSSLVLPTHRFCRKCQRRILKHLFVTSTIYICPLCWWSNDWEEGLVKILKKYDKRTGALIRLPFIQRVLRQPFFTTDLLYKLVKKCEAMLDGLFPSSEPASSADGDDSCDPSTFSTTNDSMISFPKELAEIELMESSYMKGTISALRVLKEIRSKSSTVSAFSLPPLQMSWLEDTWKKVPMLEQEAK
ncbi:SPX domain-containing protein [Salix suchowensis]|nr:SPX domain-containing protein [Salix suchowensis]